MTQTAAATQPAEPPAPGQAAAAPKQAGLVLATLIFVLLGFLTMLLLWKEGVSYLPVALAYAFVGPGIGLARTPASRSLTGSVPVTRVGMASGTADLQRDLGGAIFNSLFGALLAAGYASAMAVALAAEPNAGEVPNNRRQHPHHVLRRRTDCGGAVSEVC